MNKELIVSATDSMIKIAMLEDGRLMEFHQDKSDQKHNVGDIYMGKVKKLAPSMNAAFVAIGAEKDAFLHYHDLGPQINSFLTYTQIVRQGIFKSHLLKSFRQEESIDKHGTLNKVLQPNQNILVQIVKEPISTKGPRVTSEITIAGRYLVLVPFSDRVSISQKIESSKESTRLKNLLESIRSPGFGVIVRTVAEGKGSADLHNDLEELMQKWKDIFENIKKAKPPECIHTESSRASTILRDKFNEDFTKIYCDDKELKKEIRKLVKNIAPGKQDIVTEYTAQTPILEKFDVERQIKQSFGKHVNIPKSSGAYLVVEHTEALHVIDVNSGNIKGSKDTQEQNALEVNLKSATEVARQLRLRDMGGIIVVDFIDQREGKNRKKLFDHLRKEMAKDSAKHKILPPSKFGLIQITRQRVRPEMNIKTYEDNPNPNGEVEAPIIIIERMEMAIKRLAEKGEAKKLVIHMHPFVAAYLKQGVPSPRKEWSHKYKIPIKIMPRDSFKYLELRIFDENENEVYKESN